MSYDGDDRATIRWTHHGVSPIARLVTFGSRIFVKPVIAMWARHPLWPWPYGALELLANVLPVVRGVERARVRLEHCRAERLRPVGYQRGDSAPQAILYLHGGAFVVGGLASHRRLVSRIVKATGVPSLAVDYRQLPKSSVSTALSDCLDGLRYLIESGIAPRDIAVVGDSAGGYLALRVAMEAQRRGIGRLGAVACISPIIDLDPAKKLAVPDPDRDPLFPPEALTTIWSVIKAAEQDDAAIADLQSPACMSSLVDLAQMPPLLIQVGSEEILRTDAEACVALGAAAGGDMRIEVFEGQIHVFQAGADVIPEGRVAVARLSAHIVAALGQREANAA